MSAARLSRPLACLARRMPAPLTSRSMARSLTGISGHRVVTRSPLSWLSRVSVAGLAHRSDSRASVGQQPAVKSNTITNNNVINSANTVTEPGAGRCVQVQWRDGTASLYPFVWLRDNCQCSACFLAHPTYVRALVLRDLDMDCTVRDCAVSEDGSELTISWEGGHSGTYSADWLLARSFREEEQTKRTQEHAVQRCHWDAAQMADAVPHADFKQVLNSEPTRLEFLLALERYGLVVLKNCGEHHGQVLRLINTIGFPHTTHYGTLFEVRTKPDPINIAYTTKRLNMHADLPYYQYRPQVQILHVQQQHSGGGGHSEFTDAVHVAHELRRQQPEAFQVLADTPVDWVNVTLAQETGRSHYKMFRAPVLEVNQSTGDVQGLRFSQAQRDSFFDVPLERVERWYHAVSLLNDMFNWPQYKVSFLPENGDMMVFDNTRLVHGREDFGHPEQAEQRCLEGGYIGLDEVRDHRRTLQHRLGDNQYAL